MNDFAAIDFETANGARSSVCSVGIVIVRNGKIVDDFYSLIYPSPDYFTYFTTQVHGLTRKMCSVPHASPRCGQRLHPKSRGYPWWHTIRHSTKVALKPCLRSIRWIIPTTNFSALAAHRAACLRTSCPTTSCTPWQSIAALTSPTTTMRLPMPKHVLP